LQGVLCAGFPKQVAPVRVHGVLLASAQCDSPHLCLTRSICNRQKKITGANDSYAERLSLRNPALPADSGRSVSKAASPAAYLQNSENKLIMTQRGNPGYSPIKSLFS